MAFFNYQYHLQYKCGESCGNADGLSRLPIPNPESVVPIPEEFVLAVRLLNEPSVSASMIARWTDKDPILSKVRRFVQTDWQDADTETFGPYMNRKKELSDKQELVMWGSRVIIPPPGRDRLLDQLHEMHPGMVRMKALARSYVWWPGMDGEIEKRVKECDTCQSHTNKPPTATLHPWECPGQPWHRIRIVYAGPFEGRMILIIVDAHSKYIDAHIVPSATTDVTLTKLRQTFATLGLPCVLVSDNGTCFTSAQFDEFCKLNGIKHITSSPYHPASNGLAERAVQTVKTALRKTTGNLEDRLYRVLSAYRTTPQTPCGQ